MNRSRPIATLCLGLLTLASMLASGCASLRTRFPKIPLMGFQAIPQEAGVEEICAAINRNTHGDRGQPGLTAWRSEAVRVKLSGVPVSLPATLAVSSPRDLRLRVSHPMMGSDKADLGSNAERFWFWAEDGGPHLFTAKHEHAHRVAKQLQIPFEPDWVIDVLGVKPLDPRGMDRRPTDDPQIVELSQRYRLPDGHAGERVHRVDLRNGEVVGHELRCRGRMIARADIEEWSRCRRTGLKTPKVVKINWPQAEAAMTLRIGQTEVNPPSLTTALFELPQRPNVATTDLSRPTGSQRLLAAAPRAASTLANDPTLRSAVRDNLEHPSKDFSNDFASQPNEFEQLRDARPIAGAASAQPADDFAPWPSASPDRDFAVSDAAAFHPVQGTPVRFGADDGSRAVQPASQHPPASAPLGSARDSRTWQRTGGRTGTRDALPTVHEAPTAGASPWEPAIETIDSF